jgi:hypothetical protein
MVDRRVTGLFLSFRNALEETGEIPTLVMQQITGKVTMRGVASVRSEDRVTATAERMRRETVVAGGCGGRSGRVTATTSLVLSWILLAQ